VRSLGPKVKKTRKTKGFSPRKVCEAEAAPPSHRTKVSDAPSDMTAAHHGQQPKVNQAADSEAPVSHVMVRSSQDVHFAKKDSPRSLAYSVFCEWPIWAVGLETARDWFSMQHKFHEASLQPLEPGWLYCLAKHTGNIYKYQAGTMRSFAVDPPIRHPECRLLPTSIIDWDHLADHPG
jgi:hypothetical protein